MFLELTDMMSRTAKAAVRETKPDNVARASPMDCARVRHTKLVGLEFAKSSSAGEQIYPRP
jgi:hypothetical protein